MPVNLARFQEILFHKAGGDKFDLCFHGNVSPAASLDCSQASDESFLQILPSEAPVSLFSCVPHASFSFSFFFPGLCSKISL